ARPRRPRHAPAALPLTVLAAVALMLLVSAGYLLWPRWPATVAGPDAPALPITIAGVAFNVPPAAIRVRVQRRPGAHERVDLAFQWPSPAPADPNARPPAPAAGAPPATAFERIFVTIAAAGDTLEPAERVLNIYPRYTAAQTTAGPGGLTVLPFRDGTPYQGEDLVYDESAPGFLVRRARHARHVSLRAGDRRRQPGDPLPARVARGLARGRGQSRAAGRAAAAAALASFSFRHISPPSFRATDLGFTRDRYLLLPGMT